MTRGYRNSYFLCEQMYSPRQKFNLLNNPAVQKKTILVFHSFSLKKKYINKYTYIIFRQDRNMRCVL
jgi:hypothetical protein